MNPATTLQARQKASNTVNASAIAEGIEYRECQPTAEEIKYCECQRTAERIE